MATMAHPSTDPTPNQRSALVTGVFFPIVKQPTSNQQIMQLSQEETTPQSHTGHYVIVHGTILASRELKLHEFYMCVPSLFSSIEFHNYNQQFCKIK